LKTKNWETLSDYGLGRTYSSASEAFKDADYATGLWRCESDNQMVCRWLKDFLLLVVITTTCVFCIYLIVDPLLSSFITLLSKK